MVKENFANGSLFFLSMRYPVAEVQIPNVAKHFFKRDQKRLISIIYRTKLRSSGTVFLNDIFCPQHKAIKYFQMIQD
jgi:hypothetical protein